ncbi:hypothetical protein NT6N_36380 [Oceaniferula spumae]|uniref:Verru_Chthon cassette protein A n=1 Tax=Oceaniferula spumae TaxID=2979115 RepID=A0AAT9FRI5_9BACT
MYSHVGHEDYTMTMKQKIQISARQIAHPRENGFALVATVAVLTLLSLIVLAMISLSVTEIRSSSQQEHQLRARANARMALMMAIGQLQEAAGPDQRVTARADILEDSGFDLTNGKKYLTGVWDSGQWDPQNPDDKPFRGWLVSGEGAEEQGYLNVAVGADDSVLLVGSGSVNSNDDQVWAKTVDTGGGTGAYAYATFGNSGKISLNQVGEAPDEMIDGLTRLSLAPRQALELVTRDGLPDSAFSDIADKPVNGLVSLETMDLALLDEGQRGGLGDGYASNLLFHQVTPWSASLLTDVRVGGIKPDLSSAFELPIEDFNELEEFHNSGERNDTNRYASLGGGYTTEPLFYADETSPDLGYLFEVPTGSSTIYRGPTWDLIRNHYRQYKRDFEKLDWGRKTELANDATFAARGQLPLSYSKATGGGYSVKSNPSRIYNNRHAFGRNRYPDRLDYSRGATGPVVPLRATAERVAPVVLRYYVALGLVQVPLGNGDYRIQVSYEPYITVLNPYNVPIAFDSFGLFCSKHNPCALRIKWTDKNGAQKTTNIKMSNNYLGQGSITMRLPIEENSYVLQPGEMKVIHPEKYDDGADRQDLSRSDIGILSASFEPSPGEMPGILLSKSNQDNGTDIIPKAGSQVTFEVRGKNAVYGNGSNLTESALFHIFSRNNHAGELRNVDTDRPTRSHDAQAYDVLNDQFVTKLNFASRGLPTKTKTLSISQIPRLGDGEMSYLGAIDVVMKSPYEDVAILTGFNPRLQVADSRDYDGIDRYSPAWHVHNIDVDSQGGTTYEDFPFANYENRWADTGQIILYEVPRIPLLSLAQLQHADITVTSSEGARQIGNSFPHPGIGDASKLSAMRSFSRAHAQGSTGGQMLVESTWPANEMLWDRYFFSGMHYGDENESLAGNTDMESTSLDGAITNLITGESNPLLNRQMRYVNWVGASEEKVRSDLKDYRKIARYLILQGGFNINSTSVEAWKAVLGGLRGQEIPVANENGNVSLKGASGDEHPSGRYAVPTEMNAGDDDTMGFRKLTDGEIETLAEAMVKQVKLRGPFMGLADFANRRLHGSSKDGYDVHLLGAVQMAIEDAGLNQPFQGYPVSKTNVEHKSIGLGGKQMARSAATGMPQYLMQADVLSVIGGKITARSDSFTVRAYGESRDANGRVRAESWCEATIQRTPQWMEPTDDFAWQQKDSYPGVDSDEDVLRQWEPNEDMSELNRKFGRKFRVISFRWLSKDEV